MISCKQTAIPRGWSPDDQSIGQPVTSHCLTMIWWGRWLVRLPRLGKWFGFTITFVQRPWVKRSRKVMGRAERLKPIHDLTRSGINELGVCGCRTRPGSAVYQILKASLAWHGLTYSGNRTCDSSLSTNVLTVPSSITNWNDTATKRTGWPEGCAWYDTAYVIYGLAHEYLSR